MIEATTALQALSIESDSCVQEFNDYVYRSFIANNKDFCILTVTEVPMKRWLRGEGPAWCRDCVVRCEPDDEAG